MVTSPQYCLGLSAQDDEMITAPVHSLTSQPTVVTAVGRGCGSSSSVTQPAGGLLEAHTDVRDPGGLRPWR